MFFGVAESNGRRNYMQVGIGMLLPGPCHTSPAACPLRAQLDLAPYCLLLFCHVHMHASRVRMTGQQHLLHARSAMVPYTSLSSVC